MRPMRLSQLTIGIIVLSAILGGCSEGFQPNVLPTQIAPSPQRTSQAPDVTATPKPSPTGSMDGYVDLDHGISIPAGGPGDCTASADIHIASQEGKAIAEVLLPENLVDMGPRKFAQGNVSRDKQGRISTYTVAAGDALVAIGNRFCLINGLMIGTLNGHKGYEPIQPGEVLVLNPVTIPEWEYSAS